MFSNLLKSVARKRLLELFLQNSRQKYYLRELAAIIQYSPGSLQRELTTLLDNDLLVAEKMGNMRFFALNTKNPFLKELKQYLEKNPEGPSSNVEPKPSKPKRASIKKSKPVLAPLPTPEPQQVQENQEPPTQVATQRNIQPEAGLPPQSSAPVPPMPEPQIYLPPQSPFASVDMPTFTKPVLTKPYFEKPDLSIPPASPIPPRDADAGNLEIHID